MNRDFPINSLFTLTSRNYEDTMTCSNTEQ